MLMAAVGVSLSLALNACGSNSGTEQTDAAATGTAEPIAVSVDSKLQALLPQDILDAGVLRMATNKASSPPMEFVGEDGSSLEGFEPDLFRALAAKFGVEAEFVDSSFDSLVPAVAADRADFAFSSIGDLKARQAQVDFVDYFRAGMAIMVVAGNPEGLSDVESLCGHSVAVNKGTFQEGKALEQSDACTAAGEEEVDVQSFGDSNAARLALQSGRADAWFGDSAPVAYVVQQSEDKYELAGPPETIAFIGAAVNKENTQLRDALQKGLQALIDDGTMATLAERWGQEANVVDEITINNALL
jgi:polar amino acid transport system substrate-binding protein